MTDIIIPRMSEAESLAFIEGSLDESVAVIRALGASQGVRRAVDLPIDTEKLNAAILNSTMIGFPAGMSRRYKTIIKRTYMFADLTAKIKFPKKVDRIKRWDYMIKGMTAMGWANFGSPSIESRQSSTALTMDNIVLDIAQAAIGGIAGGAGAVMKVSANAAIEGLKGNKEALKLYESNGQEANGASFGVATCHQDDGGDAWLVLGAIRYFTDAGNTKVVFFDTPHSSAEIYEGKAIFTIFEDDYTPKKEAAANKFYEELNATLELEFGI